MAQPTNREQFKEWCLRKLGSPVIEINVSDEQVDDRVDEALAYYWDYHFDGTEKMYMKHQITQQTITDGFITVPENVIGVINIFPLTSTLSGSGIFSAEYQFVLNNLHDFVNYDLVNYYMSFQHLAFMQDMLTGRQPIRYNRHLNKLYVDITKNKLVVGNYLIYECYQIVDPNTYVDVWKDRWLQNYTAAKIKYQWGSNLTKFTGMNLPGNIQFNGERILQDAQEEITRMEQEMISSYSLPVADMIG